MGYYVRILGRKLAHFTADELQQALANSNVAAKVESADLHTYDWEFIDLLHPDGTPIVQIQQNGVTPGSLGQEEITEFLDEISEMQPVSAVAWLQSYLPTIRTILAFQIFNGSQTQRGWEKVDIVLRILKRHIGGIIQADAEGFTNEQGDYILGEFVERESGKSSVAVLNAQNEWVSFNMNLRSKTQREAFLAGKVPARVQITSTTLATTFTS